MVSGIDSAACWPKPMYLKRRRMEIPFRTDFHRPATFFFSARNFAHRFFVALPILALAAADRTRFFTTLSSLLVELPKALAAARTPLN
jgi:hypothetical protein